VLALDIGTSSVRALLFDTRAKAVPDASAQVPYQPRVAADGTAEVNPNTLVRLVQQAIDAVLATDPGRSAKVLGVGISCFWHGLLGTDGDGSAQTPLYLWSDSRSWQASQELAARVDVEMVRQRTGCLIHPTYWPAKIEWLRRSGVASRSERWLSFPDLLFWKLFGRPLTSLSMASGTGLLDLSSCRWDADLLRLLEVEPDALTEIAPAAQGLLRAHARNWPALRHVPWFTGAGDGALANLGSGCSNVGERGLTVGTSGALRVLERGRPPEIPPGLWCYRLDSERIVVGGALNNGGNLYAWLTHTLALDGSRLEQRIRKLPPGRHGLTFLPLLAGERSLGFASHAAGAIAGLTQATTAEEIARAGLEAVALQFAEVDERLDSAMPGAKRLVASGHGLLSSPAWMQMMADATGKSVAASRAREASSRGAAIFALEQLGLLDGDRLAPVVGRTYRPDPRTQEAYLQEKARQEALYDVLIRRRILDGGKGQTQYAHLQARY
jgi:gluconokinase